MTVVFLDIDGVLNHSKPGFDTYYDTFAEASLAINDDNLAYFQQLLTDNSDLMIVWSSDWRYCNDLLWHGKWKNPRLWLESQPWFRPRLFGSTPRKMSSEHFHDIKWWLDDHPDVKNYVILEDSYFPNEWFGLEKHLVQCNPARGFDANALARANAILKNV